MDTCTTEGSPVAAGAGIHFIASGVTNTCLSLAAVAGLFFRASDCAKAAARESNSKAASFIQSPLIKTQDWHFYPRSIGLRANTLAPRTPYLLAVFSFLVPRKQSK
jgi:hypothetical protein